MSDLVDIAGAAAAPGPSAELIFGDWYPAMRAGELTRGKARTTLLLGHPLLLGRKNDGKVFAMRDLCPHRGIPLSAGWFDGETVTCKYHGWEFEPCSGQCKLIPSLTDADTLDATKIYAAAYPCEERDGHAWVYLPQPGSSIRGSNPSKRNLDGAPASEVDLPAVPEVPKFSENFRSAHLSADLPCNVDHGIIGLMDPAHGPFVHQSWWWRSKASIHAKEKQFEPIRDDEHNGRNAGFRMAAHAPSSNSLPYKLLGAHGPVTTTIDFVMPNRRYETIRCGDKWFATLTTVTPVTPSTCRIDVCGAWNVLGWFPLFTPILKFFAKRFVGQDQQTMVEQAAGLRFGPALMLIDDADKPAKWYFALKQARLRGSGEHPMDGPVKLHWRS
ncbi:MAG: Rieske 2Fe-2S domain-containing protein [Acidobacteriota bacterium]|nr:Rieske 2Fe-2S domain-containing protein [Acidobacteriota bacterium]